MLKYYILKDNDIIQRGDQWTILPYDKGWMDSYTAVGTTYGMYKCRSGISPHYRVRRIVEKTPKGNVCIGI